MRSCSVLHTDERLLFDDVVHSNLTMLTQLRQQFVLPSVAMKIISRVSSSTYHVILLDGMNYA